MNRKFILPVVIALAFATLACNINLPRTQVKTGPTVSEDVNVPIPSAAVNDYDVTIKFGAGKLTLQPGATGALINGTAKYNVVDIKPVVTVEGNNVTLEQGDINFNGIPYINQDVVNEWELKLANIPMSLTINAGAYTGSYELGGLSIHNLDVTDGAAKVNLSFSQPNLSQMTSLNYSTGASDVTLTNLGNSNASQLTFKGGAGSYTLDFGGTLQRDMTVTIESGVSTVSVIIPEGVNAKLSNQGSLITVDTGSGWQQQAGVYTHPGSGYTITINAKMGAGTLRLSTGK